MGGRIMTIPHILKYTDKVKGGSSKFCFIKINPKFKDDVGLHKHELEHVKQFWGGVLLSLPSFFIHPLLPLAGLLCFPLLYTFSRKFRLWSEVQAYKVQLKYNKDDVEYFVKYLVEDYDLKINHDQARHFLTSN